MTTKLASVLSAAMLSAAVGVGTAAGAARPDLVVTSVSTPSVVAAGKPFTARDRTKNRGARRAARTATAYYLSKDRSRDRRDTVLGRRSVPRLAAGKASKGKRIVKVSSNTRLGRFFVLACADAAKRVRERAEGNNCRASARRVRVRAPTCREELDLLGVSFTVGPANPGVVDPVSVLPPWNGISFTTFGSAANGLYMDCALALRLDRVTRELDAMGIEVVDHLGIYNYRCIGGGDPAADPGCPLSEHARGRAIDFGSFSGAAVTYDVEDDWVVDGPTEETCTAGTANPEDEFLHRLVCGWHGAGLFTVILTPNYNAAQRNHIHVDLTPDASFIR